MSVRDLLKQQRPSRGIDLGGIVYDDPADRETRRLRRERLRQILKTRFVEYKPGEVTRHGAHLVNREGFILVRHDAVVLEGDQIIDGSPYAFIDTGDSFTFFAQPGSGPKTLAEFEAREQARERARHDAKAQRAAELRAQPQRAVTLADVEPDYRRVPTLAGAAHEILEHGGSLAVVDRRLHVLVPEHLARRLSAPARVLYLAEATVLDELAKPANSPIDSRLPDRHVLPTGALVAP